MRIAVLTHQELASALAVSLVANRLREHELHVFVSGEHGAFGDGAPSVTALERVEHDLEAALSRPPGDTNAKRVGLFGLATLARRNGGKLQVLAKPNTAAGLQSLRDVAPDLVLSIRYRRILHAEAIAIPRCGVLNWHSGLLPDYQGVMATFWAMRRGETRIGSTLHYIADETIDTGPVVARLPIECRYDLTYLDNVLRLYVAGAGRVADAVGEIARTGVAAREPQRGAASYYSAPGEDDVRAFRAAGLTLHDGGELERLLASLAAPRG